MINALVVEDEVAAANRLVKMIRKVEADINVVKVTDSIESTLQWLETHGEPDLIFLDIHLADGSGFRILESAKITCPVIFTTAYDQYAIQAFKVNSIDYLLKPVSQDELFFSINKFKQSRRPVPDITLLLEEIRNQQSARWQQRFIVKYADKLKSLDVNDIAYFYSKEKSVFLVTPKGVGYAIDYTLEKLESVLDPVRFFRVNRKFIISFNSISTMCSYSKSRVKLELTPRADVDVVVGSEKAPAFKEWLNR
jgi:DNA-binding LytR/AlgR family response regulator